VKPIKGASDGFRFLAGLALAGWTLSVSGDQGPSLNSTQAALAPGAPHWAARASSSVWLRYTTKWRQMKNTAVARALAAPAQEASPAATVVFGQTVFNKDASPMPQNETSIAIDPRNTNRIVGGYQDFRGLLDSSGNGNFTGWSSSTDGGKTVAKDGQLPAVNLLGTMVPSQGEPVVSVDKNGNFFLASVHYDPSSSSPNGIVVFRSPAAGSSTGVFAGSCAGGIDPDCWPTAGVVAAETCDGTGGHFNDKPYIAVDRSSSAANGSVYVVWTLFGCAQGDTSTAIQIAKCTNNLASCTAPVTLESTAGNGSPPDFVQFSHLTVGATGKVYVTWVEHTFDPISSAETDSIRLRVITPAASTSSVGTLGAMRTVHVEASPIPWGMSPYPALYWTATYPKVGTRGARAIIVWDRRNLDGLVDNWYLGSEIVAKYTDNDGATFSSPQTVSSGSGFQLQPTICVASSTGPVVIGYASHQNDATWLHRQDWYIATSSTGAAPYRPLRLTSLPNDTAADLVFTEGFIGDYQEAACQAKVGYFHYTANYTAKSLSIFGVQKSVRQQDNFLARFTLP